MKGIMDLVAMAVAAALGAGPMDAGAPGDAGQAGGQVHGAPMAAPQADGKIARVRDLTDAGAAPAKVEAPAPTPPPADADVTALVNRVQAFYEQTQDFTARFQQDYTYKTFKRKQTSSGTVKFKKPGKMRWEYEKPSAKTFVLANDRVYAWDPAAKTLTKGTFDSSQLSASVTFLWGKGKLADEFDIKKVDSKEKGTTLLLTPKKADPRFRNIKLVVDPKTAQVTRSIVTDPDGSENAITFQDFKANTGLADDAFALSPPPDAQIIDMTKLK